MSEQRLAEALKEHLSPRHTFEVRRCGRDFDARLIIVDVVHRFVVKRDGIFSCAELAPLKIQQGVAGAIASLC